MATRGLPPHVVDRPALRHLLDSGLAAPVTVLVSPAGSGKTVLLAQWARSHPELDVAWIDLNPEDDVPAHFAGTLAAALDVTEDVQREFVALAAIGGDGLGDSLLEAVVVHLRTRSRPVLIFDDVHRIGNAQIRADLRRLVDLLPQGSHVVLASRSDLGLSWGRHRLGSAMVELRAAQLALDAPTTAEVVQRISGRSVSEDVAGTIAERTEGWAAGVQLTAIALRDLPDTARLAAAFSGTDRLVADYLSEEVLAAQTDERRALLMRLSAFERISPALVHDVLGVERAAELFDELERSSMFLVEIGDAEGWYRFHHLFRDLLRYRLRARFPGEESSLKQAAARWHLAHGNVDQAIRCLVEAQAWEAAMDVILARGRDTYERGLMPAMAQWLGSVPDAVRRARPDAELLYAIVLGMSGGAAAAEDLLRGIIDRTDVTEGHRTVARSYLAARAQFRPNPTVSLQISHEAVDDLFAHPERPLPVLIGLTGWPLMTTHATIALARSAFLLGDIPTAMHWFARAESTEGGQYFGYRVHLQGSRALALAWSGRLREAASAADEVLVLATETGLLSHVGTADAYLALALIAVERGTPESAALALHSGTVRAAANRRTQLEWIAGAIRAAADRSTGATDDVPAVPAPPIVVDRLLALRARAVRLGREVAPTALDDIFEPTQGWSRRRAERVATLLTQRDAGRAAQALGEIAPPSEVDEPLGAVEHHLLTGWLAALRTQPGPQADHLRRALDIARRHDLVDVFVRVGPIVADLLGELPPTTDPFRQRIADAFQDAFAASARHFPAAALIETLTDRERELLVYLPSRLTNAELAERCFVSVNTIKTHMAHIYRKLDAPNRDVAVARAREYGLL